MEINQPKEEQEREFLYTASGTYRMKLKGPKFMSLVLEREKVQFKKYFQETMVETLSNLMKDLKQIIRAQQISDTINPKKSTPRHTISEPLKIKPQRFLKAGREYKHMICGGDNLNDCEFLVEN